jgi:serine/threonine-protein kinase
MMHRLLWAVLALALPGIARAQQGRTLVYESPAGAPPARIRVGPRLGAGASAFTHEGTWMGSGGKVALKILRPNRVATHQERLEQEGKLLLRLGNAHPALLHAYGFAHFADRQAGDPRRVLVLEYVRGQQLPGARRDPHWAARITLQLLRALRALHRRGYRHNDLHIGNLRMVLGHSETLKLLDLGTATPIEVAHKRPQRLHPYLAPEVAQDAPFTTAGSVASDIYSAGAFYLWLTTGAKPWRDQIANLPDVVRWRGGQPIRLREVIATAMAQNPTRRYQSAQAFLDDLRLFVS